MNAQTDTDKPTLSSFHLLFRSSEVTLSGMAFGSSEDVSAIKLLLLLAVMYGLVSALTYSVIHMKFVNPLGNDAPLDQFSEGRTIQHVRMLSQKIDGRQVSQIYLFFLIWKLKLCQLYLVLRILFTIRDLYLVLRSAATRTVTCNIMYITVFLLHNKIF